MYADGFIFKKNPKYLTRVTAFLPPNSFISVLSSLQLEVALLLVVLSKGSLQFLIHRTKLKS